MSGGYTYKPGTKLLLELVHGEKYAGNVRDCEDDQITLIKVYDYVTQTEGKSNFPFHFYQVEIRNIRVLEEVYEPPSDETPLSFYQQYREKLDVMIRNFKYISKKDDSFNSAMECIKTYDVISIVALVPHFGRNLYLSLLGVGTRDQVFIFDLILIGSTAFENGLKEVLESNEVLKVVHTCKLLSDSLFYHHNVSLRYVFDTQVADLTVRFRENSTVRPKPRYLKECMWFYFGVPQNVTSVFFITLIRVDTRPLAENFKISMATQAVFLSQLKTHLEEKMSIGYGVARDYWLNFRRQSTLSDSWKMNTMKIPQKLHDLKPKALENSKSLFAVTSELNADKSGTSQATSIDEQIIKMGQSFMPLLLSDNDSEYESDESYPELDCHLNILKDVV